MSLSGIADLAPETQCPRSSARTIYTWLANGKAFFRCVQDAIKLADHSIDVEFYVFKSGILGDALRALLIAAAKRGCRVRVLLDAYGSDELRADYWRDLDNAGGEIRWFNPKRLLRLSFRDHRKLVVVDASHAMVGGCNVGDEYAGDGIETGWRDLGIAASGGAIVLALQQSFAQMWTHADFGVTAIAQFRKWRREARLASDDSELLLAGAGMNGARMRARLHHDVAKGRDIRVLAAYFLPSRRLRRLLIQRATTGSVSVIVPANTDVALAHWASRYIIRQMQPSGVRFYEYQPAMLHAKLVVVDDAAYVGSANLDVRSHQINYELLLRTTDRYIVDQARATVASVQADSIEVGATRPADSLLVRWRERIAYLALSRLDPYIAQRKLRNLQ